MRTIRELEKKVEYWKAEAQRHKEVARELSLKLEELRREPKAG